MMSQSPISREFQLNVSGKLFSIIRHLIFQKIYGKLLAVYIEERLAVKHLISDMYKPYFAYVEIYFPRAIPVVDSFHVIQWITRLIDNHIRQLIKKYRQRDREL